MTGYILHTDGNVTYTKDKLSLQEMYKALGCSIVECVDLSKAHCEIWADENGLAKLTVNPVATAIYQSVQGRSVGICGAAYLRVRKGYTLSGSQIVKQQQQQRRLAWGSNPALIDPNLPSQRRND